MHTRENLKIISTNNQYEWKHLSNVFPLPKDMLNEVFKHLDLKAIFALSRTCKPFYTFFYKSHILPRLVNRLLLATIRGELNIISSILKAHPEAIVMKGTAKTEPVYVGLIINYMPIDYAYLIGDWRTLEVLVKHLKSLTTCQQSPELVKIINDYINKWKEPVHHQIGFYLQKYHQYIDNCVVKNEDDKAWDLDKRRSEILLINSIDCDWEARALRIDYLDYIDSFATASKDRRSLMNEIIISREANRKSVGVHYDLIPIIEAYHKYIDMAFSTNDDSWSSNDRCISFWTKVILFLQERMPHHYEPGKLLASKNPDYHFKYKHILQDECQDMNDVQYMILKSMIIQ